MTISRRTQWWLLGFVYAAISVYATVLIYDRHQMYARNPDVAAAAGGMYSFGDEVLTFYICALFLLPTIFLLRLLATYEGTYETYSRIVLAVSLTAPLCLMWLFAADALKTQALQSISLLRLFRSPMVLVVIAVSRWWARTKPAKRVINYALLAESLTLVVAVGSLFFSPGEHR